MRHNIAQMASASKAYIPCPLATMIKCCQRKASTPVVVAKDNSKQTDRQTDRNKGVSPAKQKEQNNEYLS